MPVEVHVQYLFSSQIIKIILYVGRKRISILIPSKGNESEIGLHSQTSMFQECDKEDP
jgi:hypothetical protein